MHHRIKCWSLAVASLVAISLIVPFIASVAAEASTPEAPLQPAQFTISAVTDNAAGFLSVELEPGHSREVTISFGMTATGEGTTALIYRADAFSQVNGGFAARNAGEPVLGVGNWLSFETETREFMAGHGVERAFQITVPPDTEPGEYVAAIVIQHAEPVTIERNEMFNQVVRWTLPVLINVPGPLTAAIEPGSPDIEIINGVQHFTVPIANSGNRIVRPAGAATLTDQDTGELVATIPVAMGSVYVGDETSIAIAIDRPLPPGSYDVVVTLADVTRGLAEIAITGNVEAADPAQSASQTPIVISSAELAPMPSAADVRFLDTAITLSNRSEAVPGVRLTLEVSRDGALIDSYPLSASLYLPPGQTRIEHRYVPADGWSTGRYTFAIVLEAVDPLNGVATVLVRSEIEGALEI